jgi:competence/damage-inducible protein CinA C-terminal domain
MSTLNKEQALVPDSCKVILNECGTAPCMEFEFDENKYNHKCYVYSLPGVPFEAEAAIPKVLNSVKTHFKLENILHKTICTFGIAESVLAQQIEEWESNLPENIHLAYLPNPLLGVRLRLSIYGEESKVAEEELKKCKKQLKEIIGEAIYGEGEDSLEKVIGESLTKKGETISVAESCTGGFLASMFTQIPGSSNYFYGGVVSYDNSIKINVLGVNPKIIEQFGAVSKECVEEMANGVKRIMQTDYAIATSGIAGPGGGTAEKPVGTVWVAVATKNGTFSTKFTFKGSRTINIQRFASHALNFFRLKKDK